MVMTSIGQYWRTIRHLHSRQVVHQCIHRLRQQPTFRLLKQAPEGHPLTAPDPVKPVSYNPDGTFSLLNCPPIRPENWNESHYGKLWTYALNYFDCLNQSTMDLPTGLALIEDFIQESHLITDGMEPYPISLRIGNWVQFLSRHRVHDTFINTHLFMQADVLSQRLEYHLEGNHLLENGFALLTAALFFQHRPWFSKACAVIESELERQLLPDGGHDERSPMYHQLLLDRLLDLLLMLRNNDWQHDQELIDFITRKAEKMLGWLETITFSDGSTPLVNDAAAGIAPTTNQLRWKAVRVGVRPSGGRLAESGYRMIRQARYELLADVGPIGPDHQPGHAHADTLSFVLHVDNKPMLIDAATSTYQSGTRRSWERSTAAHNTVEVDGQNSSEVWGSFRVGQRARAVIIENSDDILTAQHDGYSRLGITHERCWHTTPTDIRIHDHLIPTRRNPPHQTGIARFYVHPDVRVQQTAYGVQAGPVTFHFVADPPPSVRLTTVELADGFNRLRRGTCITVTFQEQLTTTLAIAS